MWVADQADCWKIATLLASTETEVRIDGPEGFDIPRESTLPFDPSHSLDHEVQLYRQILGSTKNLISLVCIQQDASQMSSMHEAAFLNLLRRRYRKDKIYTWSADVLISVNPYKTIPLLYEMPVGITRPSLHRGTSDDCENDGEEDDVVCVCLTNRDNLTMFCCHFRSLMSMQWPIVRIVA